MHNPMSSTSPMHTHGDTVDLLDKIQAAICAENELTAIIEKVEPWLRNSKVVSYRPRVRPVPENMDQAHDILKVARNLSSRTSAPAGWSPSAPVIGFSTPSPMPHQLRGGALAALQLERTKKMLLEANKKRQKDLEQVAAASKQEQGKLPVEETESTTATNNNEASKSERRSSKPNVTATVAAPTQKSSQRPLRPKQEVSMNLSDSSSSSEDDDEMEE
jgi:Vitamin-D-receptor interacting Mediator subunit 4